MANSTSLADYQVLSDASFPLTGTGSNSNQELEFGVPDDIVVTGGSRKPVLAFKITTSEATSFRVYLDDITDEAIMFDGSFPANIRTVYWESFNFLPAFNQHGNPVTVFFRCSQGACNISDVVIWYQVDRTQWDD
ncbi:MAG: hypothetical protein KME13_18380 [Myxacorys californica WJT36-NPBG1]|jgi:hypothetical protein|nr:hypothetical protein [Myxacorys californica WJT36-NPBG1]